MRLSVHSVSLFFMLVLSVGGLGVAQLAEDEKNWPIKDVTVPLELYENGQPRAEIHADAAQLPTNGVSDAKGITVSFYDESGKRDAVVKAEYCTYDRVGKAVTSDHRVFIERGNVKISGKGFTWRAENERVLIHHEVRVEFVGMPLQGLVKRDDDE